MAEWVLPNRATDPSL